MMSLRIYGFVAAIARMPWQLFAALCLAPGRLLLLLLAFGWLSVVLLLPMLACSLTWVLLLTALHVVLSRLVLSLLCNCLLVLALDCLPVMLLLLLLLLPPMLVCNLTLLLCFTALHLVPGSLLMLPWLRSSRLLSTLMLLLLLALSHPPVVLLLLLLVR
jgi:hypothetical protein